MGCFIGGREAIGAGHSGLVDLSRQRAPCGGWRAMLSAAPTCGGASTLPPPAPERWQSGRSRRTRNAEYAQAYRGFESLPLRHLNRIYTAISISWKTAGRTVHNLVHSPSVGGQRPPSPCQRGRAEAPKRSRSPCLRVASCEGDGSRRGHSRVIALLALLIAARDRLQAAYRAFGGDGLRGYERSASRDVTPVGWGSMRPPQQSTATLGSPREKEKKTCSGQ